MENWKFDVEPRPYDLRFWEAKYAVVLMMGGDGDLGRALEPDLVEMSAMVSEDMAVLALVDYPGGSEGKTSAVMEILPSMVRSVELLPETNTGDPRPLADFLARALVSFSPETRLAIGFWGHGNGVFKDYDPEEQVLSREFRFGPLGAPPLSAEPGERVAMSKETLSRSMMPDVTSENALTNREASSALAAAFSRAGRTSPVDMLFFDTCLNGSVEVLTELGRFAKTFVASALPIPGTGWNYAYWLGATRKEMPATAEEWAFLAAGTYGAAYDQRDCEKEAQLGAFGTSLDFVERFGDLVSALRERGLKGAQLAARGAQEAQSVVYGENVDLGQMVERIGELSEDEEISGLAERFLGSFEETILGLSMAPPGREGMSGLTIWCPIEGDAQKVSRYYQALEFPRVTGWLELLKLGARPVGYAVRGFWGLSLVKECEVERTRFEEGRLWLRVAGADFVEGEYLMRGGTGKIEFRNYVVLREFVRKLLELRDGSEFESFRGCCEPGWVIAGSAELAADMGKYRSAFWERYTEERDRTLFSNMEMMAGKVRDGVVLVFG